MMIDEEVRPAKRLKTEHREDFNIEEMSNKIDSQDLNGKESQSNNTAKRKPDIGNRNSKRSKTSHTSANKQDAIKSARTFTQPSAICSGDKGIFVSCDKGREKKCLLELHDLVQDYLEQNNLDTLGQSLTALPDVDLANGIEDDIAAELSSMRETETQTDLNNSAKPMQLITLDVPCVSFLRFPHGSALDPVDMIHVLCLSATDKTTPQRSRYVKRLTPVLSLCKTLNQGLQKACDEVLPVIFGPKAGDQIKQFKFAIRPTIRNNDKLNRDEVIKTVADRVQELGRNMHSVDLKQYEKGILVEVYRGWVGMSVVDNNDNSKHKLGFEQLKRFNLAEIYASR